MNTIPLVKGNTQEEINTSLIALKKALDEMNSSSGKTDASVQSQIKQINELITDINSHLDTIDGQITDLQPVDSVTSGNMQSVTSNAVSIAVDTLFNNMLQIISRNSIAGSGDWGALILNNPGAHIYFLAANRISTGDNYIAIINTYGDSNNKIITVSVLENTNNHFTLATNAQGTLYLEYFDSENKFTYSYCLFRLI